jgi:hypothetical protein
MVWRDNRNVCGYVTVPVTEGPIDESIRQLHAKIHHGAGRADYGGGRYKATHVKNPLSRLPLMP